MSSRTRSCTSPPCSLYPQIAFLFFRCRNFYYIFYACHPGIAYLPGARERRERGESVHFDHFRGSLSCFSLDSIWVYVENMRARQSLHVLSLLSAVLFALVSSVAANTEIINFAYPQHFPDLPASIDA